MQPLGQVLSLQGHLPRPVLPGPGKMRPGVLPAKQIPYLSGTPGGAGFPSAVKGAGKSFLPQRADRKRLIFPGAAGKCAEHTKSGRRSAAAPADIFSARSAQNRADGFPGRLPCLYGPDSYFSISPGHSMVWSPSLMQ